ncbi:hypothetical protein M0R45_034458 [Rubus argutus]|uniref:Uncharacterized protein n=1 Tax=Rubus argutus TaxID=59490 RepID=A0AAW1VSK6_RUBAR
MRYMRKLKTISKAGISEKIEELTADIGKDSSSEDREIAEAKIKQEIRSCYFGCRSTKEKVENLTVELGLPKDCVTQDKEPLGGAHGDPAWTSQQIKITIVESIKELENMNTEDLLQHRRLKFRSIEGFQEGIPVEPKRKRNMKPSEFNKPKAADIEPEIDSLKKKILEAKGPSDPITSQAIEKLKEDVDKEITSAFISMSLQEKLESVKLELSKTSQSTPSQPLNHSLEEKVDKIMQEFNHNLSRPGAYLGLKQKLEKLILVNGLIEM